MPTVKILLHYINTLETTIMRWKKSVCCIDVVYGKIVLHSRGYNFSLLRTRLRYISLPVTTKLTFYTSVFAIYGWKSNSERVSNTCRRLPGAVTISDLFSKTLHNTFFFFFSSSSGFFLLSLKTTAFSVFHYYRH